ncbi:MULTISPECIES: GatB/YqeY domain-containing protein [Komagataeibacter]|uniref:Aspartyl/glutamyl-tRNA amidotransferase GatB/YqeY n=2 Tax=Komagataeibacter TaxID=1434011 RepID=A0A0D6Q5M4_KOMXY|nr:MULTISPECIES: GatB/YqeY domain-containing protein [Komagataeibacter]MBL7233893.1 GatB/YqeY domain-containing protein [Komagataeibacter oboediens]MBT0674756.1 GatB/YqeY domain-containing protein [Komagataeibacter oboediens]MBT0678696.1 GatB/YqeY domain-containing protein [Komagataeibacter oboediens]MBV0889304.1 GatB/YqeY domain-containing protein [Komagataeibacter oboediens]MBV1822447.1 GatB/YqeY domain-containing protein [Komagataeibacter oboediens]
MSLRARFTDDLKTAMKAGQSEKVGTIRMITAKLKDVDIAGRAKGEDQVSDEAVISMLRGMIKSRTESAAMYAKGGRPELADKENAEIAIIRAYLPPDLDDATIEAAVREAIERTDATSMKDMGKVMAALKQQFGAALDPARASAVVRAQLAA